MLLNGSKYKLLTPKELQDKFVALLKVRFPKTEISKGALAVTLKFSDYEIQLLPAIKDRNKIIIADRSGNTWSNPINVNAFTSKLTLVNKANGNKVVPVIKLAKNLFSTLPKQTHLKLSRQFYCADLPSSIMKNIPNYQQAHRLHMSGSFLFLYLPLL